MRFVKPGRLFQELDIVLRHFKDFIFLAHAQDHLPSENPPNRGVGRCLLSCKAPVVSWQSLPIAAKEFCGTVDGPYEDDLQRGGFSFLNIVAFRFHFPFRSLLCGFPEDPKIFLAAMTLKSPSVAVSMAFLVGANSPRFLLGYSRAGNVSEQFRKRYLPPNSSG